MITNPFLSQYSGAELDAAIRAVNDAGLDNLLHDRGYYTSSENLPASAKRGDKALVGTDITALHLYNYTTSWIDSGTTVDISNLNLIDSVTGEAVDKAPTQKSVKEGLVQVRSDLTELEQEQIQGGVYDVSSHNDDAVFESLSALLGSANLSTLIPTPVRHGGMSIRFIQGSVPNSDNKYVQYRLMSTLFSTNEADWQGVDEEPIAASQNLVDSGGIAKVYNINGYFTGVQGLKEYSGNIETTFIETGTLAKYIVVSVKGDTTFKIDATPRNRIVILKDFVLNPSLPYTMQLATGETGRRDDSSPIELTLPNDAKFVLIQTYFDYGLGGVTINELNINSINTLKRIDEREKEISRKAQLSLNQSNLVADLGWGVKFKGNSNSYITPKTDIVLSSNGDSLEFTVYEVSVTSLTNGGYAFTKGVGNDEVRGIFIYRTGIRVRSDDGTYLYSNYALNNTHKTTYKIQYVDGNIKFYINNELQDTHVGQKTLTIKGFANGVVTQYPDYWKGVFFDVKYNDTILSVFDAFIFASDAPIYRKNGFLYDEQVKELELGDLMISKQSNQLNLYKRLSNGNYIKYPLQHRIKTYTPQQYPSFYDNWGIGIPQLSGYIDGAMVDKLAIFQDGEVEMAVRVPDANNEQTFVGGSAHGFEVISEESSERKIRLLINGIRYAEDSTINLMNVDSVDILQETDLYVAYSNSNPFAKVLKHWRCDKNGLSITTSLTLLRSISFSAAMFGMFCVLRHVTGGSAYITRQAVKNDEPFTYFNVEDGWEDNPATLSLRTRDKDCTEIKMWGQQGLGFALKMKDATTKDNGGMYVGTNGGQAYNKIYYNMTSSYTAEQGETLKATQTWVIE